jgi:hypothetical protein
MKHLLSAGLLSLILSCALSEFWSTPKTIKQKIKLANIELDTMTLSKATFTYTFNGDPAWKENADTTFQLEFKFNQNIQFQKSVSFKENIRKVQSAVIEKLWKNEVTYTPEPTSSANVAAFALLELVKPYTDAIITYVASKQALHLKEPFANRHCLPSTHACLKSFSFTYQFNNSLHMYSLSYHPVDNYVAQSFDHFETVQPGVFKLKIYSH